MAAEGEEVVLAADHRATSSSSDHSGGQALPPARPAAAGPPAAPAPAARPGPACHSAASAAAASADPGRRAAATAPAAPAQSAGQRLGQLPGHVGRQLLAAQRSPRMRVTPRGRGQRGLDLARLSRTPPQLQPGRPAGPRSTSWPSRPRRPEITGAVFVVGRPPAVHCGTHSRPSNPAPGPAPRSTISPCQLASPLRVFQPDRPGPPPARPAAACPPPPGCRDPPATAPPGSTPSARSR